MIAETARPIGRAISTTVTSAPKVAAVAAISSPMKPAPMTTTFRPAPSRSRIALASAMVRSVKTPGRSTPGASRRRRQDQMPEGDRAAVACLDPPRRPVDSGRADAPSEVDAMVAEEGLRPQRQAVDVHLALEESLGQRRPLIRQVVLVGQEDDVAVETLLAQAGCGLDAGVAGADDDDRGRRHLEGPRCMSHPAEVIRPQRGGSRGARCLLRPGPDRPAPWPSDR